MMLGFQQRFERKILRKEKRHTIRAKRKRPPKVGDRLDCYVNPRQKSMRLIGRWPCTKVQDVTIRLGKRGDPAEFRGLPIVEIEKVPLSIDECEALSRSDGFTCFAQMMDFWDGRLPFRGDMIHWDPERPQVGPKKVVQQADHAPQASSDAAIQTQRSKEPKC